MPLNLACLGVFGGRGRVHVGEERLAVAVEPIRFVSTKRCVEELDGILVLRVDTATVSSSPGVSDSVFFPSGSGSLIVGELGLGNRQSAVFRI